MSAIFFDIDGTLFDGVSIHQEVIDAIHEVQAKGHKCFIASGRPYAFISEQVKQIGFDGYILANGATVLDEGKIIYTKTLNGDKVKELLDYCDDNKLEYILCSETEGYLRDETPFMHVFYPQCHVDIEPMQHEFDNNDIVGDIVKVEARATTDEHYNNFKEILGDKFFTLLQDSRIVEVSRNDISKGTSILFLLDYLGIDQKDSYAFGDGMNDVGMFEAVAHPIAMGNASDEVKKYAKYSCESVYDDGIAKELRRLF